MKVSQEFLLREIAGEYMLVPVGKAATRFNGIISLNEIGSFIFKALQEPLTEEALLEQILREYQVDRQTAEQDLQEFLEQLRTIGALEEP